MNLKILTFNWHEPYLCLLSRIGHEFLVVEPEIAPGGKIRRWDDNMRPQPKNMRRVSTEQALEELERNHIDLVIAHNVKDLVFVREFELPKILVFHNRLTTEIELSTVPIDRGEYLEKVRTLLSGVSRVFISESKKNDWGLDGTVILPGLDVSEYGGYTGAKACALRVGNLLKERDLMMGFSTGEKVLAGFESVTLGMNPSLPGSRLSRGFEDLKTFFRNCRVYLNCTVEGYEDGYNLAMLEAMATGMPVVASFNSTSPIEDGVNGFISGDVDTLRENLKTLLDDPSLAARMGEKARETVREKFGIDAFLAAWQLVVKDAIVEFLERSGISLSNTPRPFHQKSRKNILLNYVSYPATTAHYLERAFRQQHNVITCGPMISKEVVELWDLKEMHWDITPQDIPVNDGTPLAGVREKLPQGWEPDLFLWVETGLGTLPPDLDKHTVPKACYLIDTHLHLEKHKQIARRFDFVFLAQKGYVEDLKRAGIEHVHWLPLGCDPDIHGPREGGKLHDVGFVGSVTAAHKRRKELLDSIGEHFDLCVERKFMDEMAQVFARSRIVFNNALRDDLNMRVFEALCSGSLLLTDTACGLSDLFEEGRHYALYTDDTLIETIRYYLDRPNERERIATEGRKEVLTRHTYAHRARTLIETLDAYFKSQPQAAPAVQEKPDSYYHHVREDVLALIPEAAECILEIGCAAGETGRALKSRKDVFVAGVECMPEAAAKARAVLDDVVEGDIEALDLPYDKASFDCVLFADVLEHLIDPLAVLKKVKPLLKPGGTVVASLPNVQYYGLVHHLVEGNWTYQKEGILDETHLRFFTFREMETLFARAGFAIEAVDETLDPKYEEFSKSMPASLNIGRMTIHDLTEEECKRFFVFQYKIRAGLKSAVPAPAPPVLDTMSVEQALEEAQALFDKHDFNSAVDLYRNIQRSFPGCVEALAQEGNCRMHLNDAEGARECYEKAISRDPDHFAAWMGVGLLDLKDGKFDAAAEGLNAALRVRPDSDKALSALGLVHRHRGRAQEALGCFEQALELNAENQTALTNLLDLSYELNEFTAVEKALKCYLKLHPANLSMLFGLAGVQFKMGKRSECRATLDLILVFDAKHADALKFLKRLETEPADSRLTTS